MICFSQVELSSKIFNMSDIGGARDKEHLVERVLPLIGIPPESA